MPALMWGLAGAGVGMAVLSGWADHCRRRRADLDRVGLIDWPTVQLASIAVAIIAVSLALSG